MPKGVAKTMHNEGRMGNRVNVDNPSRKPPRCQTIFAFLTLVVPHIFIFTILSEKSTYLCAIFIFSNILHFLSAISSVEKVVKVCAM